MSIHKEVALAGCDFIKKVVKVKQRPLIFFSLGLPYVIGFFHAFMRKQAINLISVRFEKSVNLDVNISYLALQCNQCATDKSSPFAFNYIQNSLVIFIMTILHWLSLDSISYFILIEGITFLDPQTFVIFCRTGYPSSNIPFDETPGLVVYIFYVTQG